MERAHREQIVPELTTSYQPRCNAQQYDRAWCDEWTGEFEGAPNTHPRSQRDPDATPI